MRRPLIVYCSRTGNTREVANAMAVAMSADVIVADRITPSDLAGRTMVGLGSGIYWARLDRSLYDIAAQLDRECRVFVFTTSGIPLRWATDLYLRLTRKSLRRLGITPIGSWTCRGHDRHPALRWARIGEGHPDARDLAGAESFARGIGEQH